MIFRWLFAAALVTLPFNDLPYFYSILRELGTEGAFYPLTGIILLAVIALLKKGELHSPIELSFYGLILFLMWLLLSGCFNLPSILTVQTKGRLGWAKFFLQMLLLFYAVAVSLIVYNLSRQKVINLHSCRFFLLVSFLLAASYGLIEISSFLNIGWAISLRGKIEPFIHSEFGVDTERLLQSSLRIRLISAEPSLLACYYIFIFPWIFSYIFSSARRWWIYIALNIFFIGLVTVSFSRTAYIIIGMQILLYISIVWIKGTVSQRRRANVSAMLFLAAFFLTGYYAITLLESRTNLFEVISIFSEESGFSESNIARLGSQVTAFNQAKNHPIFGIGLGQYAFHVRGNVPLWALESYEILDNLNPAPGKDWPSPKGLYCRLAAETGFPGLFLWVAFNFLLMARVWQSIGQKYRSIQTVDWFGLSLFASIVGGSLLGLTNDSFRFFGYWISLGLAWAYCRETRLQEYATTWPEKPLDHSLGRATNFPRLNHSQG